MSGFALAIDTNGAGCDEAEFSHFLQLVAGYKSLDTPTDFLRGKDCVAAKLNSASSLHTTATRDPETGSWLIAAGSVIDTHAVAPDGNLRRLLQDYLACGPSVFARCDGLFALVAYNAPAQTVSVVSDPFGYFSVFHGRRDGRVFVATSALAVAQQLQSAPDALSVNCFLRTGKVFGAMTLWRDVQRLRAATVLEFTPEASRECVYWRPELDESLTRLSLADAVDASMQTLASVLRRNLAREGKVWSDLTGGFDTRFLTMLLQRVGIPFKANFVGAPDHPDVRIARQIVRTMGWEHRHFQLPATWPQEAPTHLRDALGRGDGHLNVLLSLRAIWAHRQEQDEYPSLLSGLGGEMWRGPIWWPEQTALGKSSVVHYDRQLWSFMHPVADSVFASDASQPVRDEIIRQFREVGERCPDAPNTVKLDQLWTFRETAHVGVWASLAAGLVRIIPALFSKDIVSHVMSLNYRWKMGNLLVRHMLEKYQPALATIEIEGRGPALPRRITNFYRFIPSRIAFYRKAVNKLLEIKLGKSRRLNGGDEGYSRLEWRREILKSLDVQGLFEPAGMHSENLYRLDQLRAFLAQARTEEFKHDEFLGRIITVEMALRAAGVGVS
jgi:hypothetical protein